MFHDANHIDDGREIQADLCIIGAGPAGIAIARELLGSRLRVAVLAGGGFAEDRSTQKLYSGVNVGIESFTPYLSRVRRFGGSTSRWAGMSRPFEPMDFEKRSFVPHSGWPVSAEEMRPYYARAHEFSNLGAYDYGVDRWMSKKRGVLPVDERMIDLRVYQFAYPRDLGETCRDDFDSARNVDVYLHAHALELEADPDVRGLVGVRAASSSGGRLRFRAERFVLACGGLENPRLLLASDGIATAGLGNRHDLVGRYFTDHPFFYTGWFEPSTGAPNHGLHVIDDYADVGSKQPAMAAMALSEDVLRREELNSAVLYLIRRPRHKTAPEYVAPGRQSLNQIWDGLFGRDEISHPGRRLKDVALGLPGVGRSLALQALDAVRPGSRLALRTTIEATPNPESRVRLGRDRDRFGVQKVEIDWRLNGDDRRGHVRLFEVLRAELARIGAGRLVEDGTEGDAGWPISMSGGMHHMGTTRMHDDPRQGVVDPDCRVHDLSNLYVAGSSVFTTGGVANPTLTIIALALRLADHLEGR